jgi:tetratricopeptide (TPR) repeat protein
MVGLNVTASRFTSTMTAVWLPLALFLIVPLGRGQDPPPDDRFAKRLELLEKLNENYAQHQDRREQFQKTQQQIKSSYQQLQQELSRIQASGALAEINELQRSLVESDLFSRRLQAIQDDKDQKLPPGILYPTYVEQMARTERLMANAQRQQWGVAAQACLVRMQGLLQDMHRLQTEVRKWHEESDTYLNRYWEFGDPSLVATKTQREALLQELAKVDRENGAAILARSFLQWNMKNADAALMDLEDLIRTKTSFLPIAYALRSEVHRDKGDNKLARSDMDMALRMVKEVAPQQSTYVRWIQGISLARQEEWKQAIGPWNLVMGSGKHEVTARKMITLLQANQTDPDRKLPTKSLESIKKASQLRDGEDWSVQMVYAIALYKSKKTPEALEQAKRAIALAEDENRTYCQELQERMSQGASVVWNFDR